MLLLAVMVGVMEVDLANVGYYSSYISCLLSFKELVSATELFS